MSLINAQLKPFKATAFRRGDFMQVTDEDLKGEWSIFFFYPADLTFVCPTELGDLADNYEEFQSRGLEIYSVSTDAHFTHKARHETSETIGKIRYTMIGDRAGIPARAEGRPDPGGLAGTAGQRSGAVERGNPGDQGEQRQSQRPRVSGSGDRRDP